MLCNLVYCCCNRFIVVLVRGSSWLLPRKNAIILSYFKMDCRISDSVLYQLVTWDTRLHGNSFTASSDSLCFPAGTNTFARHEFELKNPARYRLSLQKAKNKQTKKTSAVFLDALGSAMLRYLCVRQGLCGLLSTLSAALVLAVRGCGRGVCIALWNGSLLWSQTANELIFTCMYFVS